MSDTIFEVLKRVENQFAYLLERVVAAPKACGPREAGHDQELSLCQVQGEDFISYVGLAEELQSMLEEVRESLKHAKIAQGCLEEAEYNAKSARRYFVRD